MAEQIRQIIKQYLPKECKYQIRKQGNIRTLWIGQKYEDLPTKLKNWGELGKATDRLRELYYIEKYKKRGF